MATRRVVVDCAQAAPSLEWLERLARATLAFRRMGLRCTLINVSASLRDLIAFAGLDGALRVEPERKPEQREQLRGVEEERDLSDPPA